MSARLYETESFAAVGTTSAGIAACLGFPDGERAPFHAMLDRIGAVAAAFNAMLAGRASVPRSATSGRAEAR